MKMQNLTRCTKVENLKQQTVPFISKSWELIYRMNLKVFSRNYVFAFNFKTSFSISRTLDISNFFLGLL